MNFDYNYTSVCSEGSKYQYSNIGSDYSFAPARRQAIISTNNDSIIDANMRHSVSRRCIISKIVLPVTLREPIHKPRKHISTTRVGWSINYTGWSIAAADSREHAYCCVQRCVFMSVFVSVSVCLCVWMGGMGVLLWLSLEMQISPIRLFVLIRLLIKIIVVVQRCL